MRYVSTAIVSLLAVVLLSCGTEAIPTATTQDDDGSYALAEISDAPAQSGPFVVRMDDIFGWTIVDLEKDLTVYAGFDIHEYCDWVVGGYQGEIPIESAPFAFRNPGGGDRWMLQGRGENMTTSVWPTAHDWRDECFTGYYHEVPPVASGYSTAKAQDNGGAFPDTPNTNSFGVKFNGKLQAPGGDKVNMTAHMQCVWSGPDEDRSPARPDEYPWQDGNCISTVNLSGQQ